RVQRLRDVPGDGRLAGSRPAGDPDDEGLHRLAVTTPVDRVCRIVRGKTSWDDNLNRSDGTSQSRIEPLPLASFRRMLHRRSLLRALAAGLTFVAAGSCVSAPLLQAPETLDLVVVATTDVHGYIRGWDYYTGVPDTLRGLTRAATIIDSLRR